MEKQNLEKAGLIKDNSEKYKGSINAVINYLLLHRNEAVSFRDIQRATRLNRSSLLKIMADLSTEGIVNYKLDSENTNTKKLYRRYGKEIADRFEKIWRGSK